MVKEKSLNAFVPCRSKVMFELPYEIIEQLKATRYKNIPTFFFTSYLYLDIKKIKTYIGK